MFNRNFMKAYNIRKYQQISGKAGSVNTDMWMTSDTDYPRVRIAAYCIFIFLGIKLFNDAHIIDEAFDHQPRPLSTTYWQMFVPKEVLYPNLEIIEGFNKIAKIRDFKGSHEFA